MARWAPYMTCPECGTGYWRPPAGAGYWTPGVEPSDEQHRFWSGRGKQWLAAIGPGPGRLLDVGCAFGHFVRWAGENGWDSWGVERDPWAREKSVAPPGKVVAELTDLEPAFDVATLWDVLEHVPDPIVMCETLRKLLRPGGFLLVGAPNFAAMKLRWPILRHRPEWFNRVVQPAEHFTQFTEKGIVLSLKRAGYSRVELVRPPLAGQHGLLLRTAVQLLPVLRTGVFARGYALSLPADLDPGSYS